MVDELRRAAYEVEAELTGGQGGLINYEYGTIGATEAGPVKAADRRSYRCVHARADSE